MGFGYSPGMIARLASSLGVVAFCLAAACGGGGGLSVTGVKPNKGPYNGGDTTTIEGSGFSATAGVTLYFGDKKAKDYRVESEEKITVRPPANMICSVVDIKLVFDDARSIVVPKAYTYIDPLAPFLGLTKDACQKVTAAGMTAAAPQEP